MCDRYLCLLMLPHARGPLPKGGRMHCGLDVLGSLVHYFKLGAQCTLNRTVGHEVVVGIGRVLAHPSTGNSHGM